MSTTPPQPSRVEVTTVDLRRGWGFVLAFGIACVVAGLLTLVWPGVTVLALVIVLGVFLLFAGVSEIGWALAERHTEGWKIILARGIIDLITGLIVLVWPDITVLALALILAAWLFVYAAVTLWYAYRHRDQRPRTGHFVIKGAIALVAGLITVVWPGITVLAVAIVIGIALIMYGAILIALGLNLRRQPAPPQTTA
jgi:uncharacterized membrane protein HdeD (DUF308 family)